VPASSRKCSPSGWAGRTSPQVCALAINECAEFLRSVDFTDRERQIAERVLKEINAPGWGSCSTSASTT
jgi:excinuclease UvrABC ATPase subunit